MPSSCLAVVTAALISLCSRTQAFVGVPSASAAAAVARGQSALSMAAKPDQLPAQAKRYYVRSDRILDVLTSAPQLLLRLGSGALVDGYQGERMVLLVLVRILVRFLPLKVAHAGQLMSY